jgi:hypothetical protein
MPSGVHATFGSDAIRTENGCGIQELNDTVSPGSVFMKFGFKPDTTLDICFVIRVSSIPKILFERNIWVAKH